MSFNNMFRWDWKTQTKASEYEHYDNLSTEYGNSIHANISLSVTYTLKFGKKVDTGNESREQNLNSSGILY